MYPKEASKVTPAILEISDRDAASVTRYLKTLIPLILPRVNIKQRFLRISLFCEYVSNTTTYSELNGKPRCWHFAHYENFTCYRPVIF
jgi:hypothetical protein